MNDECQTADSMADQLEKLAGNLVDEAMRDGSSFSARLDLFKALSTYHIGRLKIRAKLDPDGDDAVDFNSVKQRLRDAGKGVA